MNAADTHPSGGHFGSWDVEDGLPFFDIRPADIPADAEVPDHDVWAPWHHIGNDALGVTVDLAGHIDLWSSTHGLVRLTAPRAAGDTPGWHATGLDRSSIQTRLGVNSVRIGADAHHIHVERTVWIPFGDLPAVIVEVRVHGDAPDGVKHHESFEFSPYPIALGGLMSRFHRAPSGSGAAETLMWSAIFGATDVSRRLTDAARTLVAQRHRVAPEPDVAFDAPHAVVSPLPFHPVPFRRSRADATSWLPRFTGCIAVAAPGAPAGSVVESVLTRRGVRISASVPIDAGHVDSTFRIVAAVGSRGELEAVLARAATVSIDESAHAYRSPGGLDARSAPAVSRESVWHNAALRSSACRDDVMGRRFVPQGSAYTYIHGVQGAPRDYAITAVPLTYFDPDLARDQIRTVLYMSRSDGSIEYAHTGAGKVTSAAIHPSPSDLPLFLLWCLTEHVFATGGNAFLDEAVRDHRGDLTTVADRALDSWRWLRDVIGLGPHGLLRVGSGDWCDPISLMVPSRRAFHRHGESTFNSAMACHVLPRAAALLESHDANEAASMRELATDLRSSVDGAWNGRWFLRGWDGLGSPVGDGHLFVDANAWCLIARAGTGEQRTELVSTIDRLCVSPSRIGATMLDRPHSIRFGALPPGWDCNGGVWAAVNAFLAWGFAMHDPERAWSLLNAQTLAAHADAYPAIWYGIWSGPDAYNSYMGGKEGETFVQPATPMAEWPVSNSNAHAGPLLALLKVLGVDAGPDGITCSAHIPPGVAPLSLRTAIATIEVASPGRASVRQR